MGQSQPEVKEPRHPDRLVTRPQSKSKTLGVVEHEDSVRILPWRSIETQVSRIEPLRPSLIAYRKGKMVHALTLAIFSPEPALTTGYGEKVGSALPSCHAAPMRVSTPAVSSTLLVRTAFILHAPFVPRTAAHTAVSVVTNKMLLSGPPNVKLTVPGRTISPMRSPEVSKTSTPLNEEA